MTHAAHLGRISRKVWDQTPVLPPTRVTTLRHVITSLSIPTLPEDSPTMHFKLGRALINAGLRRTLGERVVSGDFSGTYSAASAK